MKFRRKHKVKVDRDNLYPASPRLYTVVDPARAKAHTFMDFRGSQNIPERPLLLPCDFCMTNVDRLWAWRKWPVCTIHRSRPPISDVDESEHWWACVHCSALVRDRALEPLIARVLTLNALPPDIVRTLYEVLFQVLRDREPARIWTAGEKRESAG
jgi:hypothetical protein